MNSKELIKRGFTEPIPFVDKGHGFVPKETGIYIITLNRDIEYPSGTSDIVKIGKAGNQNGFYMRWNQYFHPGHLQKTNLRLKPKFEEELHGFAWLILPKGDEKVAEKRLLSEFLREHGQRPIYNRIHG